MCKIPIAIALFCCIAFIMTGCDESSSAQTHAAQEMRRAATPIPVTQNSFCKVHFRHDVLGIRDKYPISVTSDGVNSTSVTLQGRFVRMDDQWIVLSNANPNVPAEINEYWVPRDHVLYLKFTNH